MKLFFGLYILSGVVGASFAMQQMVKLKDGSFRSAAAVEVIIKKLKELPPKGMMGVLAVYELQRETKNPGHSFFCTTDIILKACGLLEINGKINDTVRSVVLSSVKIDEERQCLWVNDPVVKE